MVLQLPQSDFPDNAVQDVVKSALRDQANLARLRLAQFERECNAFEEKFKMTSEEFARKFDSGELGANEQWFD